MKLGIGTAQFGLDYGISNQNGKTPAPEVANILALAAQHHVSILDTAPAYGTSEAVLGDCLGASHAFRIVTKTPVPQVNGSYIPLLEQTFQQSLQQLQQPAVYGVLVHHAETLLGEEGDRIFHTLNTWKHQGRVQKIGVSVYDSTQIDQILALYPIDLIQVPINVFDQRLIQSGHLQTLNQAGIEIHARSVFLQGLLLLAPASLPPFFASIQAQVGTYCQWLAQRGISRLQAALQFVANLPEVNTVLVGVNHTQHLQEILTAWQETNRITNADLAPFAITEPLILNPSNWQL